MADDIIQGQWKQIRGRVKSWWGKLSDSDLDRIQGNRDLLIGTLQEKYGYTRAQAAEEIDRRLNEYKTKRGDDQGKPYGARP